MCAKFQQKILTSMVVGACQSFECFRKITWFLKNKRALSKFKACVGYFLSNFYFSPNDNPSRTMKNVFYFI